MSASVHRSRVNALVDAYDTKLMTLATIVIVRDYLEYVGLPSDIGEAYVADIEARNIVADDQSTEVFVPPVLVPDIDGNRPRNPTGNEDEDLRSELAMFRRVLTETKNMSNRIEKMCDKYPNSPDVQRLGAVTARLETQAVKARHLTEAIIDNRF